MPTFGQHETGERLHLSGVGAMYALKSDSKKIVKVLQPPIGIWGEEQMRAEVEAFLSRTKIQRAVARSSENWAPILEAAAIREGTEGSSGGGAATMAEGDEFHASGAFLVMDRYERSVQSLIDGRVNLNNADLRTLMTGVLKGLRDIRIATSQAHGNLKPSNILLANSADLEQATIHLTDPAAPSVVTAASGKKDFGDLAKILYELVTLRPYQGGTIPRTRDWNDLGPNGEDWRKLCNSFVDIGTGGGTAEERDLDKIIAAVDTWRAKPRGSKIPMIAAGVLLVIVAIGITAYILTRPPKLNFDEGNWEKLCLNYQAWFENFATMDDATKKKFSAPPYPTEVVKLLNNAGRDLDRYEPQNIAKKPQSSLNLAIAPTEDAKTGYGPYYTREGDALIDKVAGALTPAHWQLLGSLDKTAAAYEARGWRKPAAGIRALIESAKPPALPKGPGDIAARAKEVVPVNMVRNIEDTIAASNSVLEIDQRWASIQAEIKTLPATDVPLLEAFPKFAEDVPRSGSAEAAPGAPVTGTLADVQALSASFSQIEQVIKQLSADLNKKGEPIDFAELAKDPAAQVPADGKITPRMYTALAAAAKGYVELAQDPRKAVAWSGSLEEIQKNLIDPIKEANPQDPHLETLAKDKAAVEDTIAAFNKLAPIARNREQLVSLVSTAKQNLDTLKNNGETWVAPYIIDPAKYIAQQRARLTEGPLAKATPVVYAQWKKADAALLDKVAADPQQLKKYRTFQTIDGKFAKLQNIYADFDKAIPAHVPGLSDMRADPKAPWKAAIAGRVATVYRDQALTDIMTNPALKWADDLPQVDDPAYQSYEKNRLASYEQTRSDALSLIDDFSTIQSRLDHLDLRAGEPTKDAKTWRDLLARWKDSKSPPPSLLADADITADLKPITARTSALLALDDVTDYKTLAADSLSPAPEIALTAWRKAGEVPISESLPVLADEEQAEKHLAALLPAAGHEAETAVTAEMKAQRPLRWHRYAATLTTADAIQNALDQRQNFAVTLSPRTDPNLVYDSTLYDLRKDFEKNPKEAELKEIAKKFIADVNAMPASVSKDKNVQDLLARMAKPLAPGAGEISTAGAGPKLAGWEQESPNPDVRIFYFPSKAGAKHVLEFTRIQAGQKTVFLCTTDVSFGLFAHIANQHVTDLDNAGKPAAQAHWFKFGSDPWDGPRVWKTLTGKFMANDDWLFKSPQMGNTSPYPVNAAPQKPGPEFPMQVISPWSAMYIARALGCRLPTVEEWKAAYDKFEATGPKDAWNLRGSGWLAQQKYSGNLAAQGAQYPDNGIFLSADQMFAGITADAATPWTSAELAKIAPNRISGGGGVYPTSTIWFHKVDSHPNASGLPQDLVGNVAQYTFDGPGANAVIKDANVSVDAINAAVAAGAKNIAVIGGSSLSPPQIPINQPQAVDPDFAQTSTGFADVGFRLAYTAPIDSIGDVLAAAFRAPPYLPGASPK